MLLLLPSVTWLLKRRLYTIYNNIIIAVILQQSDTNTAAAELFLIRNHRALQRTQSKSLASAATILNGKRSATDAVRVTRPGGERMFVCFGLRVSRRRRQWRRNVILFTSREK